MKREWIKTMVSKLVSTGVTLLFLVLVPAAAAGSLPLWVALVLGLGGVLALNAACGVLLAGMEAEEPALPAVAPQQIPLRVVRGGRAA